MGCRATRAGGPARGPRWPTGDLPVAATALCADAPCLMTCSSPVLCKSYGLLLVYV